MFSHSDPFKNDLRLKFHTTRNIRLFRVFVMLVMCFTAFKAHAQTKSAWAFYDVKLSEIVRVGLSQLLNKSFVADDAFVRDERRVTIDLKVDQAEKAGPILIDLLLQSGYKVENEDGIWKIRKLIDKDKDLENETFIYRPKFRSASYFYDVLGIGKNRSGSNTGSATSNASVGGSSSGIRGTSTSSAEPLGGSANANSQDTASAFIDRSGDVVFFRGAAAQIAQYRDAIAALDVAESQCDVTVSVYEYSATEQSSTAIGAIINLLKGKISGQIGTTSAVGSFLRLDTGALQLLFSMLAEDKRFNLISSPNVRVKSGATSRISVGASVPTLSSTTQSSGQVTQSVVYQPTGVILEVQPNIYQDVIDLKIRQSVSEAISTNTGVNNSPTLTNRELLTSVSMVDGESIALGGLTSFKQSSGGSGLSFLPHWSRSSSKNDERTELLIFLRVNK